jgi:hypothetical protein
MSEDGVASTPSQWRALSSRKLLLTRHLAAPVNLFGAA